MNANTAPSVLMLRGVAERLGPLRERVVFLGGAVTGLLLTDPAGPEVRFTADVDVIVEIVSRLEFYRLEETLRGLGFMHDRDIICRWKIDDLIVDVMPIREEILGFSNRWYPDALESALPTEIAPGLVIRLVTAPCFLATKLEAFHHPQREYHGDYLLSRDMADVISVIDGRPELTMEIQHSDQAVKSFLVQEFRQMQSDRRFLDACPVTCCPMLPAKIAYQSCSSVSGKWPSFRRTVVMPSLHDERLARAALSLDGLSVGDAFGERYFGYPIGDRNLRDDSAVLDAIEARYLPELPWNFTDDTQMALSIVSVLRQYQQINQDILAMNLGARYDPSRGYGPAMNWLIPQFWQGGTWQSLSGRLFDGQGSFGNGGAMRVAPVGAYFADDIEAAADYAARSSEVTHAHPEAVAGAIAVAVGAAWAWRLRDAIELQTRQEFLERILPSVPDSEVKHKIQIALNLPATASVLVAMERLGNGSEVTAQDTVPFVLWCAGQHLDSYEEALWLTVSGLGDRDTTCAMVGGIVALSAGAASIPAAWLAAREPLPRWPFQEQSEI